MTTALHADEIPIDVALARSLVDQALPEYGSLALRPLEASGSSNALFRLGSDLLVRMPRQPGGSATIEKEFRWLPLIESGLTISVPRVLAVCEPALGYPERWSVTRWIDGQMPTVVTAETPEGFRFALAEDLAQVIRQMRDIEVPAEAIQDESLSWYRGGPLGDLDDEFRESIEACRRIPDLGLDLDAALHVWDELLAVSGRTVPGPRWYHGDLLAENLLARDGRLVAVLDFGGLAVGDPSVDLIAAWEVLDRPSRARFRDAVGADEATWLRSMGWALFIAVVTFPYYWDTMPARCANRRAMASAVLADVERA